MVELPSNAIEADRFMDMMDLAGGSIGSNDLVQTVYAVSHQFSPASRYCQKIQCPSLVFATDEFPPFLIDCGITSISVTPDINCS